MVITKQQYGSDPLQTIEIFSSPPNPESLWVIYIHGGAWVDNRNTALDGKSLFDYLLTTTHGGKDIGYAGINYRLSPPAKHPDHIHDVVCGINFLNPHKYILIGHSAGGFLALQSLYCTNLPPPPPLGIIISEGIYDLPILLDEYPQYHSFVDVAFGTNPHLLIDASPARKQFVPLHSSCTSDDDNVVKFNGDLLLVHSLQDQLLSSRQHEYFIHSALHHFPNYKLFEINAGQHDDVYVSNQFFIIVNNYISSLK